MVKEHFRLLISEHDVNQLDRAYKVIIILEEYASEEEKPKLQDVLKSLDIPEQKIEDFMMSMKEKYQENFTPEMEIFLRSRLDCRNLPSHAETFAMELGQVIEQTKQSPLKGFGLFDTRTADMSHPSSEPKPK